MKKRWLCSLLAIVLLLSSGIPYAVSAASEDRQNSSAGERKMTSAVSHESLLETAEEPEAEYAEEAELAGRRTTAKKETKKKETAKKETKKKESKKETTKKETKKKKDDKKETTKKETKKKKDDKKETTKKETKKKKDDKKETTKKETKKAAADNGKKTKKSSSYLLPKSNSKYLEWEDVKTLTQSQYRIARNEIYARHGYIFKSKDLKKHFENKSWYKGTISADKFDTDVFNDYERYNVKYLKSLEPEPGLSGLKNASTKEKLDSYGYENGCSRLAFWLKEGTAVSKGKYYLVDATWYQAITVPGNLKIGDKTTVVFNGLTGEKKTLVRKKDGLHPTDDPGRLFYYKPKKKGRVVLYEDSDDRVERPIYEGKLYIRKDCTQEIAVMGDSQAFNPKKLSENAYYNGVYFDTKGYAVRLVFYGD